MSTLAVTTLPECTWTAAAQAGWISELKPTAGQGNGEIQFRVAANPAAATRQADIFINDVAVRITQQASPCSFTVSPAGTNVAGEASSLSFVVSTLEGCSWTVTSDATWLAPAGAASRTGPGVVVVNIAENAGDSRSGTIAIAGQTVTIDQAAMATTPPPTTPCTYSIDPITRRVTAAGEEGRTVVETQAGCAWTATSHAAWITIAGVSGGTGSGPLRFIAAPNSGSERAGTLTVAGRTLTVTQDAAAAPAPAPVACTYALTPTSHTVPAAGATGLSTTITTPATCAWTASSEVGWLSITAGSSGTGTGTVTFSATANSGPARSGTIVVGGAIVTVNQGTGCSVTIAPTSQAFGATGGTGTPIEVTAAAGCPWTSADDQPWIAITSGTSGTGNGSVGFTVDANVGPERTGTITVGGRTFTVSQASGCSFSVTPTSFELRRDAESGLTVSVTSATGCAWAAVSGSTWILVTEGASGSGPGTVTFSVERNRGGRRTGTLTVAGQTVTVLQDN
jgi:hypothetical protein